MTETDDGAPLIIAHRGASGQAPENTIAAIEEAIRQSADFVEVDLQLTRDGKVVLVHDATLTRTSDAAEVFPDRDPWRVNDFTLDELRTLDAGSWFGPAFAGERIPTLREALEVMDGRIGMWLELKSPRLHPGLEKATAEILRSTPGGWLTEQGTCVATCFDAASLDTFAAEVAGAIPCGQLASTVPSDEDLRAIAGRATYFIPDCRAVRPGEVARIRAAGLGAVFWTPNDPVMLSSLVMQGAAGLIGNYPGLAGKVASGRYRAPESGLLLETLIGSDDGRCTAVLRNLGPEPIDVTGWQLRGDPAAISWTGRPETIIAPGQAHAVEVARTDSIALHRPDGALVDVTGRVS
ncbi:MAG TPA: glycerophosphodiester phosphodiesterase family protein [Actinopolymorphaceae bacterium]